MSESLAQRVLVIGWDAADWRLIDPLLSEGEMPNLQRLISQGVRADLTSLDPKLSPILWTSIATGKTADKHGILNFIEPSGDERGVRIVASTSRKTKAIWNILSQSNRKSVVVNWYATHPAEPIRGICVSNSFQEGGSTKPDDLQRLLKSAVHPPDMADQVARCRTLPSQLHLHELQPFFAKDSQLSLRDRRMELLRKLLAQCRTVHATARMLLRESGSWDCAMVFYDMIDVAGHHFMQYHPPRMSHVTRQDFEHFREVMNSVYRLHDRMLGELMAAAGDQTTFVVLSDHGFHSDHLRPAVSATVHDEHAAMDATWHRQTGMLALSGPGVRHGSSVHFATLLDVAPTVLALLGLPAGEDMDGRVLTECLTTAPPDRVNSWDEISGEDGQHPQDARVDAFDSAAALQQLVDLGYIQPLGEDLREAIDAAERESRFNLAVVYMSTHRFDKARPLFERLHAEHPNEYRFASNLARCQQAMGEIELAKKTLERFLEAAPDNKEAPALKASLLAIQGFYSEAISVMRQAYGTTPSNVTHAIALAEYLRLADQNADAEQIVDTVLRFDRTNAAALLCKAKVAMTQNRLESAAETLLDALSQQHTLTDAHYALGVALAWMGEHEHAEQSFRIALQQSPGMIDGQRFLAHLEQRRGDVESAQERRQFIDRLLLRDENKTERMVDPLFTRLGPEAWSKASGS